MKNPNNPRLKIRRIQHLLFQAVQIEEHSVRNPNNM